MIESIFVKYYWAGLIFWISAITLNFLLGKIITNFNQNTLISTSSVVRNQKSKTFLIFLMRFFLITPAILLLWWFFTSFIKMNEVYLVILGSILLQCGNRILGQLSSLFTHQLTHFFKYKDLDNEYIVKYVSRFKYIGSIVNNLNLCISYIVIAVSTHSWFFAGGIISCTIDIAKNLVIQLKNAKVLSEGIN